jgi:hypothetical protein
MFDYTAAQNMFSAECFPVTVSTAKAISNGLCLETHTMCICVTCAAHIFTWYRLFLFSFKVQTAPSATRNFHHQSCMTTDHGIHEPMLVAQWVSMLGHILRQVQAMVPSNCLSLIDSICQSIEIAMVCE